MCPYLLEMHAQAHIHVFTDNVDKIYRNCSKIVWEKRPGSTDTHDIKLIIINC